MSVAKRDYYGGHAADYARSRPGHPEQLYQQLFQLAPHRRLAWDVGTGNGQVAMRLGEEFEAVWASDMSSLQLQHATNHPRVTYHLSEAHQSGLADNSVALVTAASAVHWFDQEKFYREALRVLSPGGVLAVWTYAPDLVAPEPAATLVRELAEVLRQDWPPGIEWVDRRYTDLPFPLPRIELERIDFALEWSLDSLCGWVDTWSGVRRYRQRTGRDPMPGLRKQLLQCWPAESKQIIEVQLPLYYRVGQKPFDSPQNS